MTNTQTTSSWKLIQDGVKETEKLLGQKEYNLAMIKARQTLEYMVKSLYRELGETDNIELIDMIDELYKNKLISKTSCENYHKIRMIGNKAAHQNDTNAYSANNAYSLLSQELVTFSHAEFAGKPLRPKSTTSKKRTITGNRSLIKRSRKNGIDINDLIRMSIPLLLIILLIVVLRYCSKRNTKETLAPSTTVESSTDEIIIDESTEAVSEGSTIYLTTSNLNVRSAPSTEGTKLATLPVGSEIEYIKAYDNDWAVINYNGAQAYVSSKYIKAKQ